MNIVTILLIIFLSCLAVFQALLAFGVPFGRASRGGQHSAVLPFKLRISSAISAVFLLFVISVVLSFTE